MSAKWRQRAAARLAAVQALYQIEITGRDPAAVVAEFGAHRHGGAGSGDGRSDYDTDLLEAIVLAAAAQRESLDLLLAEHLAEDWSLPRLGATMGAMLRAATWELSSSADVPPKVVISEYVNVARGFCSDPELGFVNGLLDRLARRLRGPEMAPGPHDQEAGKDDPAPR